jgi:hypothetical protein
MADTATESTPETLQIIDQKSLKPEKAKKRNLKSRQKITVLGIIEKKADTETRAPSYTSHNHIWHGKAPSLNRKAVNVRIIPTSGNSRLEEPSDNLTRTSNEVEPNERYMKENPRSSKQEERAPRTKYFNPASLLNSELRQKVAKT